MQAMAPSTALALFLIVVHPLFARQHGRWRAALEEIIAQWLMLPGIAESTCVLA
jgi:hypothetical protein